MNAVFDANVGFDNFLSHETQTVFNNDMRFSGYTHELNSLEQNLDFSSTQSMWNYAVFGIDISTAPQHSLHALYRAITAIATSFAQPCIVFDGVSHNFFACPELYSVPVSSVVSSLIDYLTITSESGGGTKPPTTKTKPTTLFPTTLLKAKANATANVTMELKENNARVLSGSTMTSMTKAKMAQTKAVNNKTRIAKAEGATINVKAKDSATQILMQMRYLTIQSASKAITIQSVPKSTKKRTSKKMRKKQARSADHFQRIEWKEKRFISYDYL